MIFYQESNFINFLFFQDTIKQTKNIHEFIGPAEELELLIFKDVNDKFSSKKRAELLHYHYCSEQAFNIFEKDESQTDELQNKNK